MFELFPRLLLPIAREILALPSLLPLLLSSLLLLLLLGFHGLAGGVREGGQREFLRLLRFQPRLAHLGNRRTRKKNDDYKKKGRAVSAINVRNKQKKTKQEKDGRALDFLVFNIKKGG